MARSLRTVNSSRPLPILWSAPISENNSTNCLLENSLPPARNFSNRRTIFWHRDLRDCGGFDDCHVVGIRNDAIGHFVSSQSRPPCGLATDEIWLAGFDALVCRIVCASAVLRIDPPLDLGSSDFDRRDRRGNLGFRGMGDWPIVSREEL